MRWLWVQHAAEPPGAAAGAHTAAATTCRRKPGMLRPGQQQQQQQTEPAAAPTTSTQQQHPPPALQLPPPALPAPTSNLVPGDTGYSGSPRLGLYSYPHPWQLASPVPIVINFSAARSRSASAFLRAASLSGLSSSPPACCCSSARTRSSAPRRSTRCGAWTGRWRWRGRRVWAERRRWKRRRALQQVGTLGPRASAQNPGGRSRWVWLPQAPRRLVGGGAGAGSRGKRRLQAARRGATAHARSPGIAGTPLRCEAPPAAGPPELCTA